MIARVLPDLSLDKEFDYLIPEELLSEIRIGCRVSIPFGRTTRFGYVTEVLPDSAIDFPIAKAKPLNSNEGHLIPEEMLKLAYWIADYYCSKRIHTVRSLLPAPVRNDKVKTKIAKIYRLAKDIDLKEVMPKLEDKTPQRALVLQCLLSRKEATASVIKRECKISDSPIRTLIKEGLIVCEDKEVERDPFKEDKVVPSQALKLTAEQSASMKTIIEKLDEKNYQSILLRGVTGCGKTEIYLQAIDHCLKRGQQAIVLVPEISLTPQTTYRFRARFGEQVSVLHSRLSDGERYDQWMNIHQGKTQIVVGARSALFAPFKNLGLIVVDEEHEASYKQDSMPRYNARDIAVKRAQMQGCMVMLGSATPSFESLRNAELGKYTLCRLDQRVDDKAMPVMSIVDMRNEAAATGQGQIFSRQLIKAIHEETREGMQVILFLNRRGFAHNLQCHSCGYNAECQNCSCSYTYHKGQDILICHHCGSIYQAPPKCPSCHSDEIKFSGIGTEKVERLAKALFPDARVARMDSDTMKNKDSHKKALEDFQQGKTNILIGTQMIAKGLHFPKVTLVGVMFADMGLNLPDFRASERTFQLLTQVAGRAGRGNFPGKVFVQTYTPFHSCIQYALDNDLDNFYKEELIGRGLMKFPPLSQMAIVHIRGENENQVINCANAFVEALKPHLPEECTTTPVMPNSMKKVNNHYRYHFNVITPNISLATRPIKHLLFHGKIPKGVKIHVDVDPQSVM